MVRKEGWRRAWSAASTIVFASAIAPAAFDRATPARASNRPPTPKAWNDADANFYAESLKVSDYVAKVGGALKSTLGRVGSLLDIGAGTGALGRVLIGRRGIWTAIEPNDFMVSRLDRLAATRPARMQVIRDIWQNLARHGDLRHDVVLAANMGGPIDEAGRFVATLKPLARRWLCWTVPAQIGPRRYCLSGFLPSDLHGEDEVPGVARALAGLGPENGPDRVAFVDWTFRAVFPDRNAANEHFLTRFGNGEPHRQQAIRDWLGAELEPTAAGWVAEARKTTAILLWRA